jgi:predicted protein tyrosine phosphatase
MDGAPEKNSWAAIVPVVLRFHKRWLILDYHGVCSHEARITCLTCPKRGMLSTGNNMTFDNLVEGV